MPDNIPRYDDWVKKISPRDRVLAIARTENIPDDIAEDYLRLTRIESGHNINVRDSSKGAQGFGQVMPDRPGGNVRTIGARQFNLRDPDQNIAAGLNYFAQGGSDPVARRLYYFGGPKAKQTYERKGRIPNISDGNMTADQYVRATGGLQQSQRPSQVPSFDEWVKTSEQIPPPDKSARVTPKSGQQSAPNIPIEEALKRLTEQVNKTMRPLQRQAKKRHPPEVIDAGPSGSVEIDLETMRPREYPAMQARTPSYWERLKETVAPYVPGLSTLDTPGGIKTDVPRGVAAGLTLGYAGDPRQVSKEEEILDPEAQTKANVAHAVGEYGTAFIPYVGAEKAVGTMIKGTNLASRAARTGAVFGGVEAARQGVNAIRGRETDLAQIPKSTVVGALSGGLMGRDPGVLRRVGSIVAPQAVKEYAEGAPTEQIASSAVTNTLFGLMGGSKAEKTAGEIGSPKTEPGRREITPNPPPSERLLRERIASEAEARDQKQVRQEFNQIREREGLAPLPEVPAPTKHYSAYQPRRVRGEGKGQFKKGKPVVPEATDAETIRSNQEVIPEVSPAGVGEGSEIPRSENLYLERQQPVDQVTPGQVLTRRQAEPPKVAPPLTRQRPIETKEFKQWFGESRVRDELGEPLVAYHGTRTDFETFDRSKVGQRHGEFSSGFHFTSDPDVANIYAGPATRANEPRILPVYLRIEHPLRLESGPKDPSEYIDFNRQKIMDHVAESRKGERSFDGVIVSNSAGQRDYIVFEPTQIKSATGNKGTFDPRNPSITDTEAQISAPTTRAALQARPLAEQRQPLTLVRNQAERSFPKSAEAAGLPGGENLQYDPITNEQSLAKADKRIEQVGVDRAASEIATRKEASADDVATGIRLMQTFTKAGQHERAADVASDLAQKLTHAGQSVQAASIISRLSPEGVLLTAQRQLPTGKKLTPVQSEALVSKAKTVQEADARIAGLERQIAEMQANVSAKKTTKPRLAEKIGTLEDRLLKLESEARARLEARKQQPKTLGPQSGASAIPLDIADYAIVGAAKIARKGMSTAKWTTEMISEFGEEIRPHLQKIYSQSYSIYDTNRKEMVAEAQNRSVRRDVVGPVRPEDLSRLVAQKTQAQKDSLAARRELLRTFEDLSATPLKRALSSATGLRRANLLSALKTHLRNIVGNTAFQVSEEAARPMAALADVLVQRRTGLRTTTLPSLSGSTRAAYAAAIKEGPSRAVDIMLGRETIPLEGFKVGGESSAAKMQLNESRTGIKLLDAYVNTVFRTLQAEDAVFKVYAFRRELADIAKARAMNERAQDSTIDVNKRAAELRQNPTDAMLMEAASYADYATFQNKNQVSSAIAGGKRLIGSGGTFAVEQLAPFDRTPTNIIARTIENSPLGFISAARKFSKIGSKAEAERLAGRIADEAFTAAEQKEFARTFGRASTGTILVALAIMLSEKGLLTGAADYDTDKGDYMKKRREAGGGGMLRVPGTNQRISIIDTPVGKAMATAAGMYEQATADKKSLDERLTGSAKVLANTLILDQPLVRGMRDIGESPSLTEAAGTYGASYVPGSSALKAVSDVADPSARLVRGQGAKAQFEVLTPMTRQNLPVDPAIDPAERGNAARRLLRMADPLNTTTEGRGPRKRARKKG